MLINLTFQIERYYNFKIWVQHDSDFLILIEKIAIIVE